jgi:hypothetical protein
MTTRLLMSNRPFLMRFAKPIGEPSSSVLRYDTARQITQVLQNGQWVDTPDSSDEITGVTRKTAVQQETTDDE